LIFANGLAEVGWDILADKEFADKVMDEFKGWRSSVDI